MITILLCTLQPSHYCHIGKGHEAKGYDKGERQIGYGEEVSFKGREAIVKIALVIGLIMEAKRSRVGVANWNVGICGS